MNLSQTFAASLTLVVLTATAQTSRHTTDKVDAETATGTRVRGIPSDAMGTCNDGMFSKATSKSACQSGTPAVDTKVC